MKPWHLNQVLPGLKQISDGKLLELIYRKKPVTLRTFFFPASLHPCLLGETLHRVNWKAMCAKVSLSLPCQNELGSQNVILPKGQISYACSLSLPHSRRCICRGSSALMPGIESSSSAACHFKLSLTWRGVVLFYCFISNMTSNIKHMSV